DDQGRPRLLRTSRPTLSGADTADRDNCPNDYSVEARQDDGAGDSRDHLERQSNDEHVMVEQASKRRADRDPLRGLHPEERQELEWDESRRDERPPADALLVGRLGSEPGREQRPDADREQERRDL